LCVFAQATDVEGGGYSSRVRLCRACGVGRWTRSMDPRIREDDGPKADNLETVVPAEAGTHAD